MCLLSKHPYNIILHLKKYKVKKNYLFVPTPSEEILAIGTPITRPNNSTVHSSYLIGEGEKAENGV